MARLGDVCSFYTGTGFPNEYQGSKSGKYPFFKVGDISKNVQMGLRTLQYCDNYIDDEIVKTIKGTLIPQGTVVFAKIGEALRLNRRAITPCKCLVDNNAMGLKPKDEVLLVTYFYHFMTALDLQKYCEATTVPSVRKTPLEKIEIDIPSMDEQNRIATVLDKLDDLISLRKQQLAKLDELVRARFVEMFGDPILNQKKFPCYIVDDVITFQGGSQPDKKFFEYEPSADNIRLIQIRDYKSDNYVTYIPKSMARRFCNTDDIMIGRYGPPIFQILQGIEGAFNVALMKAIPKKGNKEFIRQFLKQDCLLHYLEGLSKRTAGQDGIQMDKLKAYPFPFPPIEMQDVFASFQAQINRQKLTIQQSLDKLEMLKKSLMQEYFG